MRIHELMRILHKRFKQYNLVYHRIQNVVPSDLDTSTLFICSGMQHWKDRFRRKTKEKFASNQACIRTDDLDLVGDGQHLTSFNMIGNFSFGGHDYEDSVAMWDSIINDLGIKSCAIIHIHSSQAWLRSIWVKRNYNVINDDTCIWSDGSIGGYCCEIYYKGIEIGNLVYTDGDSTDVGFGLERLLQVVEDKARIDETSLFDQRVSNPIVRDHYRTLKLLYKNKIQPGNKGKEYVCRRLIRRCLSDDNLDSSLTPKILIPWFEAEQIKKVQCVGKALSQWKKHRNKPALWWWDTFGITVEEYEDLKKNQKYPIGFIDKL